VNDKPIKDKTKFTVMGVRYRLVATGGSRWGEGKVHLQFWSRDWKEWVLACRPSTGTSAYFTSPHDLPLSMPITCKTCIKRDPR
jgi:hypothetical protein